MDAIYDFDELKPFLGVSILILLLNVSAMVGSVVSALKTWRQYRMVHTLSISSAFSLLLSEILIFIMVFSESKQLGLFATIMFFENIYTPLAWYTLFRVVHMAGDTRLQFQDPEKYQKAVESNSIIKTWTLFLVATNLVVATMYGVDAAEDSYVFLSLYLLQYFGNIILCLHLIVVLSKLSYYRDIHSIAPLFYVAAFLLTCVSIGSLTFAALFLGDEEYYSTVTLRLIGSITVLMINTLFPTTWIRHIRKSQDRTSFMPEVPYAPTRSSTPAESLNDHDSLSSRTPYDTEHQHDLDVERQPTFSRQ